MARKKKGKTPNFKPVKRPGALTSKADKAHEGVQEFANKHYNDPGLKGKQARFAVIAKKWRKGGKRKSKRARRRSRRG